MILDTIGWIYFKQNKYNKALTFLQRSYENSGNNFLGFNLKFFKHALEWDYFLGVISFYLLTFSFCFFNFGSFFRFFEF